MGKDKSIKVIEYITHHDFISQLTLSGLVLSIPKGAKIYNISNVLVTADEHSVCSDIDALVSTDAHCICLATSENGKRYFARNDDGNGMERGQITHSIAFEDFPFTADDIDMLRSEYADWLQPRDDVILFNDNFFAADIDDLKELLKVLTNKDRDRD